MKHYRTMGTLGLLAWLVGLAAAQSTLQGVKATKTPGGVEVAITGNELGQPKVIRTKQNRSYVLEWNASLKTKPGRTKVNSAGVNYVWHGWFTSRPEKVRVQLWLANGSVVPTLTKTNSGWSVTVGTAVAKAATPAYEDIYATKNFETLPPINPFVTATELKATPIDTTALDAKKPETLASVAESMQPKVINTNTTMPVSDVSGDRIVSLDFVNTDVNLILKALAAQADVNIVTSPEVGGRINVKLDSVTLVDALNLVTTIANVRYTKIGKTYLVTTSARFSDAIRQVIGKLEEAGETRVIQLVSGEGKQIKAATLKAVPQLSSAGVYDLILPTESIKVESKTGFGATSGAGQASAGVAGGGSASGSGGSSQSGGSGSAQGSAQGSGTASAAVGGSGTSESQSSSVQLSSEADANKDGKDPYIVIVGSPERITEVVKFIHSLDEKIAEANSLSTASISTRIIPLYSPNSKVILDSVQNMISRDPRAEAYKVVVTAGATLGKEEANQLLVITGPVNGLDALENLAKATDTGIASALGIQVPSNEQDARKHYEVVDLMWIEPVEAAKELETRVRGLSASLMPAPVDPNVNGGKVIGSTVSTASNNTSQATGGQGTGGTNQGSSSSSTGQATATEEQGIGLKKALGTEPMKLLLFGTDGQIAAARSLLGVIDLEPKQVAIDLRVVEMSKDDANKFGLDWSILTGGFVKSIKLTNQLFSSGTSSGNVSGNYSHQATTFSHDIDLDSLLTDSRIISRPNTLALDGRSTRLFIGDTVRYVEQIQASQSGVTVITGKVDIGVTLKTTPRIGPDGSIQVNFEPTLTILKGFTAIPNGGQLPQTSERSMQTNFVMKSGETLALGGLIQDSDRVVQQGLPFLKDLPIIGRLFRSETTNKVRTEIVFFVTVREVEPKSKKTAADPRVNQKNEVADPNAALGTKKPKP